MYWLYRFFTLPRRIQYQGFIWSICCQPVVIESQFECRVQGATMFDKLPTHEVGKAWVILTRRETAGAETKWLRMPSFCLQLANFTMMGSLFARRNCPKRCALSISDGATGMWRCSAHASRIFFSEMVQDSYGPTVCKSIKKSDFCGTSYVLNTRCQTRSIGLESCHRREQ